MYRIIGIVSAACLFSITMGSVGYAQYDWRQILTDAKSGKIYEGINLSKQDFRELHIPLEHDEDLSLMPAVCFRNVDFSDGDFVRANLEGASFENCDFTRADLTHTKLGGGNQVRAFSPGCDFTDAEIQGANIYLDVKQLQSTATYKRKDLNGMRFAPVNYGNLSFAGFNLTRCTFISDSQLANCDFTDACIAGLRVIAYSGSLAHDGFRRSTIAGARLRGTYLKIEQLLVTKDFKTGIVRGLRVDNLVFPNSVVDLSNMVFTDCCFAVPTPAKVDLTGSVIVECDFRDFDGLTLENIKSTWNYKYGRMKGIALPEEIQKALDAEKEK